MWIIFAISASILWGFTYVLDEQIYKHISVTTSIAVGCFVAFIITTIIALVSGNFWHDIHEIATSKTTLLLLSAGTATFVAAEIFIALSISSKNATLAGLIEISYPLFIALLAYFIFKENHATLSTVMGGVLIFAGVAVIYLFNR